MREAKAGEGGKGKMTDNTINSDMTMGGGASGTLLAGRYRVVKQLGQGGMGSVWLAEDLKLDGHKVAVKMLPSILVSNKRAYQQVKAEALVSLKLSHPNIVTVRAFEEEGGNPFLVMDYIDGQTLDDYLAEKGKLTEEETVKLLKPVAAALDYAHAQGVVHRDVKPGNVMIRKDGTPFVLDFGIAREIQETMTRVTGKLSSGTLLYMSPEQLNGAVPKPAQDIYSFAAMAYECLKGKPPFSRGQIEYQILHNDPEPFQDEGGLRDSVLRGLFKDPAARPQTCSKLFELSISNNNFNVDNRKDVAQTESRRLMKDETVAGHEAEVHESYDPVEFDLLMVRTKVCRRNIELAYNKIVEFCKVNPGFAHCQEDAWELLAESEVDSHPETPCAARKYLAKLEDIERKVSQIIAAERENREAVSRSRGLRDELLTVLLPDVEKYKASKYATTLYTEGMDLKDMGQKAFVDNKYAEAARLFGLAKDSLLKAAQEAKSAYVKTVLAVAGEYKKAEMWDDLKAAVLEGLAVDPENAELCSLRNALGTHVRQRFVICASIDGEEVQGAAVIVDDNVPISLPARIGEYDSCFTLPRMVRYECEDATYVGWVDCQKIDFSSRNIFVMVPLRPIPGLLEMMSKCKCNDKCDFLGSLIMALVYSFLVGVVVSFVLGRFSKACVVLGLVAMCVAFLLFLRKFLSAEIVMVLGREDSYSQQSASKYIS